MDIRLREVAAKAAGTYFIVTDNSTVSELEVTSNLRLVFINSDKGPVNTVVVFKQGDTDGFKSIFGKGTRKQRTRGNFSIESVLAMLPAGPVAVMNLRSFSDDDKLGVAGLSANQTPTEKKLTQYTKVFNTNSLWTAKAKNIVDILTTEALLNIGNVGTNDVSFFVVASKNYDALTNESDLTLTTMSLEVDEFEGVDVNTVLKNTFVDVYVFNNTFDPLTVSTNKYFGQLFDADGQILRDKIEELSAIPEAGFNRRITGSLLPNLKNEFDEDISIDTLMNAVYAETGLICYINSDSLETLPEDGTSVINTEITGYYNEDGTLKNGNSLLSHVFDEVVVKEQLLDNVVDADVTAKNDLLFKVGGGIFPAGNENLNGNKVLSIFEQGVKIGDEIIFKDTVTNEVKTAEVLSMEVVEENVPTDPATLTTLAKTTLTIPAPTLTTEFVLNWTAVANATSYSVLRKKVGDADYSAPVVLGNVLTYTDTNFLPTTGYVYVIKANGPDFVSSFSAAKKITSVGVADDVATVGASTASVPDNIPALPTTIDGVKTYTIVALTLTDKVTALSYVRKKKLVEFSGALTIPTNLTAYKPRAEQFIDGSSTKQKEILDVMLNPGIVKGLKAFTGLAYLIDGFKSFIEPSYKYQFGQLALSLDQGNKFVRNIINEPFIEDLEKSTNPLFKSAPGGTFDLAYLPTGGNPQYSTKFLTKFTVGSEMSFFFGTGVVNGNDLMVMAPYVSNVFINKTNKFDVAANATGYLDNVAGVEVSPDNTELKSFEKFNSNAVIKTNKGFTIYGNLTGQKTRSALQEIHNSELLAYIKESLFNMSRDEAFKKGLYNEYLATEIEVGNFFENLVLVGAIQPNPVVKCDLENNTEEIQKQKIKLIHIEYLNVNSLDKIVFDLNLN